MFLKSMNPTSKIKPFPPSRLFLDFSLRSPSYLVGPSELPIFQHHNNKDY